MKHGSLFNGIGGFQLAAHWMGWENTFSCEIDDFCNKVTKKHFPNCIQHGDIKTTDFTIYRGAIDVLTGGFPCQPFSTAGKRKGTEDDRHLWPQYLRAIQEIQPSIVVGENVSGILNWSNGMVFEQVCVDLANEGYEVQPVVLPACGFNAPHRRSRVWFIANSFNKRAMRTSGINARTSEQKGIQEWNKIQWPEKSDNIRWITANNPNAGIEGVRFERENSIHRFDITANAGCSGFSRCPRKQQRFFFGKKKSSSGRELGGTYPAHERWDKFPTQSPVCGGNDGLPDRLDGITFSSWRTKSIKGYGNAIVPQIAYEIFKAIEATIILTP